MKAEELKDELAGLEAETANISDLLVYIASTIEDAEIGGKNKVLACSIAAVACHLDRISDKLGDLFLQA